MGSSGEDPNKGIDAAAGGWFGSAGEMGRGGPVNSWHGRAARGLCAGPEIRDPCEASWERGCKCDCEEDCKCKQKKAIFVGLSGGPRGNYWDDGIDSGVKLNFPNEYLTGISGYYQPMDCNPVIRSLTFRSNFRTFGPFGQQKGTPFSLPMEGGKIVCFRGRSGMYVDNLGFYVRRA